LPRSFTASEAGAPYRRQLLEMGDVFELWELPKDVFPDVTARTIVLFAQKHSGPYNHSYPPARVRTVQPNTYKHFQYNGNGGLFTVSTLVNSQLTWHETRESPTSTN